MLLYFKTSQNFHCLTSAPIYPSSKSSFIASNLSRNCQLARTITISSRQFLFFFFLPFFLTSKLAFATLSLFNHLSFQKKHAMENPAFHFHRANKSFTTLVVKNLLMQTPNGKNTGQASENKKFIQPNSKIPS